MDETRKAAWRAYYAAEQDLYGLLTSQTILFQHGEIAVDDGTGLLKVPRYPHAIVQVEPGAVAEFVALAEQMEGIYTDLTGKHRRKHPRYIPGPVESIQITQHSAHSSQTITADTAAVVIGSVERKHQKQVVALLAAHGLAATTAPPLDDDAAALVTVTGANLLAYAGAPSLRHRVATGPAITAFVRRPGEAATRVAVGLIVLDTAPAQVRLPDDHGRKKRSDTLYDDDHEPQIVKLPTVDHFTQTGAQLYIPV